MNSDDKIREILRMEADAVEPSPAGWDAIRQGIARRRERTWWTRGTALAGAAAVFLGVVAYVAVDRSRHGVEDVTGPPGPTGSFTNTPTASPPAEPPAAANEPIGAIWPLTTRGEVAAWDADPETYPALKTSRGAALAFARRYLGVDDGQIVGNEAYGESTVELRRGRVTVATLSVKGFGKDGTAPFVVTHARGTAVSVWTPRPGAALNGVFEVRGGVADGVDGRVEVVLRQDDAGADPTLRQATAQAERTGDGWAVQVSAAGRTGTGSLLVVVHSTDGSGVEAVEALPVTFGAVPGPPVLVAARGGRIAVLAKESGQVERWLTEAVPGAGASDPELTDDAKSVVYVQSAGACSSEVRVVPVAGGEPKVLVPGDQGRLSHPSLRGEVLTYVRTLCQAGGDEEEVVVRNSGTEVVTWRGDVVGGPVTSNRYVVFTGARDGGPASVWLLDSLNEREPVNAAPPESCAYRAATWGPVVGGGSGENVYVATVCGSKTYLDRLGPDLRDPDRMYEIGVTEVTTLDFAGADLLVGADGRAYVVDEHDAAFVVPGEARRPTWS